MIVPCVTFFCKNLVVKSVAIDVDLSGAIDNVKANNQCKEGIPSDQ